VIYQFVLGWNFGCSIFAAAFGGRFFAPLFYPALRDLFLWFLAVYRLVLFWLWAVFFLSPPSAVGFCPPFFIPLCGIYFFDF